MLILGSVVVAVAVAAVVTSQTTKQYASTARVFISTTPSSTSDAYQGGLFSQQRVSSYADVLSGLELSQRVIDQLQLDIPAGELAQKIQASVVPDTVVLKITVTDPSPIQAQRINDGVVEHSRSSSPSWRPRRAVHAAAQGHRRGLPPPAHLPGLTAADPQPRPGAGPGLLLGFGLAVLREILDTSVKRTADVPALGETPVLSALAFDPDVEERPLISACPRTPRAPRPSGCCAPTSPSSTSTRPPRPSW